jgi:hypothetical protein
MDECMVQLCSGPSFFDAGFHMTKNFGFNHVDTKYRVRSNTDRGMQSANLNVAFRIP